MTHDSDLMSKAGRIRDLFEQKWVEEQMQYYRPQGQDEPSRDEQKGTYGGQIDGAFDWVLPEFEWFTGMSKSDCDAMKAIVDQVRDDLGKTNVAETPLLASLMKTWWGNAAVKYEERFLTHFPTAVDNQKQLAMELGLFIHHVAEHIDDVREAINGIADEAINRLQALYSGGSTAADGAKFALTIFSAAVAVAAAVASSGALTPILLTSGSSIVSSVILDPKVNGDTIAAVQGSLIQKIRELQGHLTTSETAMGKVLDADCATIDQMLASDEQRRYLFPGETSLSDGFEPTEIRPRP